MKKILLVCFMLVSFTSGYVMAQDRTVSGVVKSGEDGQPLPGVNVVVKATGTGVTTDIDGNYKLNVPSGGGIIQYSFIGFITEEVEIGNRSVIDVSLNPDVKTLGEVIVSGLAAGTPEKKLSFSIGKVDEEIIQQVPAVTAGGALQGKVAGVRVLQSTRPGTNPSILLRGATSITGSSEPLIVVDGVLIEGGLGEINVQDIERMEVLKGASGASLYGSRAANGVILIFTKRGNNNAIGETRVRIRNEFGAARPYLSRSPKKTNAHHFQTNADGTILTGDDPNGFQLGVADPVGIQRNRFSEPTFDHIAEVFTGGEFMTNFVGVTHNSGTSNIAASYEHTRNTGPVLLNDGNTRHNFRVNLDQRVGERLKINASTLFIRNTTDNNLNGGFGTRGAIRNLFMMDPSANFFEENIDGTPYRWNVNKFGNSEGNPLYTMSRLVNQTTSNRFLGNFGTAFDITDDLTFEYNYGIDNREASTNGFLNVGHLDISATTQSPLGAVFRSNSSRTAITSTAAMVYVKKFGDVNLRSRLYYMYENNSGISMSAQGQDLAADGLNRLQNARTIQYIRSFNDRVTANNFAAIVGGDFKDKYIFDALIRREAVSLFGANERWQTFARLSGNYRLSEDVTIPGVQELSFRGSYGTAGGRPIFNAQYEAFPLADQGNIGSGGTLGNADLRPNITEEIEIGINMEFLDRFRLNGAYSIQDNRDQIMLVPLSAGAGQFSQQWQNAGRLETNTWEVSLGYDAIKTSDVGLTFNLIWDRTQMQIAEFNRPDQLLTTDQFDYGVFREGLSYGNIFGQRHAKSLEDVANQVPAGAAISDHFEINREGYVIPAGTEFTENERPVLVRNDDGTLALEEIGNMFPQFAFGLNTNFRYKGLNIYMLWDGQVGGDVYNRGAQWMARDFIHPMYDQSNEPEGQQRYMTYYQGFYNVAQPTAYWVEDATHLRLRELAINYSFGKNALSKVGLDRFMRQATVSFVGRNLLLFASYSGFDPQVGSFANDPGAGNYLNSVDSFAYPLTRTFSGAIEFTF